MNYPDVIIIEDKYQFKPPRPFSPGSETFRRGQGRSARASPRLKVGDRVLGNIGSGGMRQELV